MSESLCFEPRNCTTVPMMPSYGISVEAIRLRFANAPSCTTSQLSGTGPISVCFWGSPRRPSVKSLWRSAFFSSVVSAISRSCCSIARCTSPNTAAIFRCSHGGGMTIGKASKDDCDLKLERMRRSQIFRAARTSKKNAMKVRNVDRENRVTNEGGVVRPKHPLDRSNRCRQTHFVQTVNVPCDSQHSLRRGSQYIPVRVPRPEHSPVPEMIACHDPCLFEA